MKTSDLDFLMARSRTTEAGCLEWTGWRLPGGYGQATRDTKFYVHRRMWELHHGPIPDGLYVLHTCDNPPCMEITHLRLGTQADNLRDMSAKGRSLRGSRSPTSKLTEELVSEMKAAIAGGASNKTLAKVYGVSDWTVSMIRHGKMWSHVKWPTESLDLLDA